MNKSPDTHLAYIFLAAIGFFFSLLVVHNWESVEIVKFEPVVYEPSTNKISTDLPYAVPIVITQPKVVIPKNPVPEIKTPTPIAPTTSAVTNTVLAPPKVGPIIISILGPRTVKEAEENSWSVVLSGASDPGAKHFYSASWGEAGIYEGTNDNLTQDRADFTHTYYALGTYEVIFTVRDSVGGSDSETIKITVEPTDSTGPVITNISPTHGPFGTRISLTGRGFTDNNTIFFGGGALLKYKPEPDGKIYFIVPTRLSTYCEPGTEKECVQYNGDVGTGKYQIFILNENGISPVVQFTIDAVRYL